MSSLLYLSLIEATQTLQMCYCVSKCKKKFLGYDWVLPRTARRHCDADQQAVLPMSAIPPSPARLSRLGLPESSLSNQMEPSPGPPLPLLVPESMENDFSGADYKQANSDEYDFDYPQDFYLPTDSSADMDNDNTSSNGGSQGIDNHAGQFESRPETPDNTQLHKEYSRGP